ncbi:MAG: hypothetical protein AB7I36_08265 [Rhodospirillaceae bacterium]
MADRKIMARNGALLIKMQSAAGTYSSPAGSDAVLVENPAIGFNPTMVTTDEMNPSLDSRAPLPGGLSITLSGRFYLKGSGTPGVAPEWDPIAQICGFARTTTLNQITGTDFSTNSGTGKILAASTDITALTVGTILYADGFTTAANNGEFLVSAVGSGDITVTKSDGSAHGLTTESAGASVTISYGVRGVAATAGSTTQFTAQSPWSNTADLYRFMPVLLSGNPATPAFSQIRSYSSARVAVIENLMGSALTTSTKVSIPAHTLYLPASDSLLPASAELYFDNAQKWSLIDLVGQSWKETWMPNGTCAVDFTATGKLYGTNPADSSNPAAAYDSTRPGLFFNSQFLVDRTAMGLNSLSYDLSNTVALPSNPNDAEGFDAPVITGRAFTMNFEPNLTTVATRSFFANNFRPNTPASIHARLTGGNARNPGQRIMRLTPTGIFTGYGHGNNSGMKTEQIPVFQDGFDSGSGLAIY